MVRKLIYFLLIFFVAGCGAKKKTTYGKERTVTVEASKDPIPKDSVSAVPETAAHTKADEIIHTALTYTGVRYKFGGTTRKGMDCSGLLYVSFGANHVVLPRVSYQMAKEGRQIKVKNIAKGDLLFFKTSRKGKRINHVGLVVDVANGDVKFIHASTSRGVIVSSLHEGFWNYAFVKATRIL